MQIMNCGTRIRRVSLITNTHLQLLCCTGLNHAAFDDLMLDDAKWLSKSEHGVILQLIG